MGAWLFIATPWTRWDGALLVGLVISTCCYVVLYLLGPRGGPFMERKLKCIGFKDDWNYVNGETEQHTSQEG